MTALLLQAAWAIASALWNVYGAFQAFTASPALWPSEFWRYAGVAVNAIGMIGAVLGIGEGVRRLRRKPG